MAETENRKLKETLFKLRKRIEQIRDRQEILGEQNTKAALIDPLLSALGWDIEELDEVCREYKRKSQDNPVDYALFIHRSPVLFVEAKSLKGNLADRKWISQTLGYATVVGVEWCVLTNGDEYRLYNSHAAVDVEEKLFRTVRLSDSTQDDFTLDTLRLLSKDQMGENSLEVLWKAHFVDRHIKTALDNLLRNEDAGLIRLIRNKTKGITPSQIRESLKRADIKVEFPMISTTPPANSIKTTSEKAPSMVKVKKNKQARGKQFIGVKVTDLIQAGLITTPLEIECEYKGQHLRAVIRKDGQVEWNGKIYSSLSTAATMARESVVGRPLHTNGWLFWMVKSTNDGKTRRINWFRRQYLNKK